ncbi:MAG: hypothetical protein V1723_01465 [Candidatus Uhrbacteria bacterium]
MPWYFLAEQVLPNGTENAITTLNAMHIPANALTIQHPISATGVAFSVPEGRIDVALEFLGLAEYAFVKFTTNVEDVKLLNRLGKRQCAADRSVAAGTPGRDAFANCVSAADSDIVAQFQGQIGPLRDRVNHLQEQLAAAATRLHRAELRLAVYEEGTSELVERLRGEYDAIAADPRVASLTTTKDLVICTTHPLILESDPPRLIGRLQIVLGLIDESLRIAALDKLAEYPHPNVSKHGVPCLGMYQEVILRRMAKYEYGIAFRLLLDFLREPPIGEVIDAMRPECWPEADNAMRERIEREQAKGVVPPLPP